MIIIWDTWQWVAQCWNLNSKGGGKYNVLRLMKHAFGWSGIATFECVCSFNPHPCMGRCLDPGIMLPSYEAIGHPSVNSTTCIVTIPGSKSGMWHLSFYTMGSQFLIGWYSKPSRGTQKIQHNIKALMSNVPLPASKNDSLQTESWQYEHYILSGVLKIQICISNKSSKYQLIVN
jgi:hypothetical protein